jgi:hypothetical protein
VPEEAWHVPFSQVVYVGDGSSDMPAFPLMHEHQGTAIGVFSSQIAAGWHGHQDMRAERRVYNLAQTDYSAGSERLQSLMLAVGSLCKQSALRRLSLGE